MPSFSSSILSLAAGASLVAGHGHITEIIIGGSSYQGYLPDSFPYLNPVPKVIGWAETATDNGFVSPDAYAEPDIICHRGGANAPVSAKVAAGDAVSLVWSTWPESHHGPVIDYLAECSNGDCSTVDKTSLEFFKISEQGLISGAGADGTWATDTIISGNLTWTTHIPKTVKPGQYVLRHEILALHSAGTLNGAQNYPFCFNLEITGSGTKTYAGTKGESLYKNTDPGISVDIYNGLSVYTIPGPTLVSDATETGKGGAVAATASGTPVAASGSADSTGTNSAATSSNTSVQAQAAATSTILPTTTTVDGSSSSPTASAVDPSGSAGFSSGSSCSGLQRREHARDVKRV